MVGDAFFILFGGAILMFSVAFFYKQSNARHAAGRHQSTTATFSNTTLARARAGAPRHSDTSISWVAAPPRPPACIYTHRFMPQSHSDHLFAASQSQWWSQPPPPPPPLRTHGASAGLRSIDRSQQGLRLPRNGGSAVVGGGGSSGLRGAAAAGPVVDLRPYDHSGGAQVRLCVTLSAAA
jgi:hypothetical protein